MFEALWKALTPFLWGGALALVLNIPLRALERRLTRLRPAPRRALALTVVLLCFAAAILLGLWLLVPQLAAAAVELAQALPGLVGQLGAALSSAGAAGEKAAGTQEAFGGVSPLWQAGMNAAKSAAGALGNFFLAAVLAAYLLAGQEHLAAQARRLCRALLGGRRARAVSRLARRAAGVFSGFVAGQCLEACILAGLFVLALLVCRMPYVLPISAVIGVTALIPVFGAWAGCAAGVLLILPVSAEKAGWFLVLFFAVQQFENNVIYPRVVGSRIGLPPLWVLAAVLLGGGLFGISGVVLGIPAMSVLYHVGGEWVRARLCVQAGAGAAGPDGSASAAGPGQRPG
jgi:predicted PurR-regulated permease PerM